MSNNRMTAQPLHRCWVRCHQVNVDSITATIIIVPEVSSLVVVVVWVVVFMHNKLRRRTLIATKISSLCYQIILFLQWDGIFYFGMCRRFPLVPICWMLHWLTSDDGGGGGGFSSMLHVGAMISGIVSIITTTAAATMMIRRNDGNATQGRHACRCLAS